MQTAILLETITLEAATTVAQASYANVERDDGCSSVEAAADLNAIVARFFEEANHSAMMAEQIVDGSGVAMTDRGNELAGFATLPKIVELRSEHATCILNPFYGKVISSVVMVMLAATAHDSCYVVPSVTRMANL